jgi:Ran GTPase-activating protein (RanGAP) involved in mRNA processing and transport
MNAESFSEILQVEVFTWKTILGIRQNIVIITNENYWREMFDKHFSKKKLLLGGASTDYDYIFINVMKIHTYKEFLQTIVHELLHIRYPNKSESQIRKLEKRYVP